MSCTRSNGCAIPSNGSQHAFWSLHLARKQKHTIFERPHRYEDDAPQPVWPSFAEKLLLTLIDAHRESSAPSSERAADPTRQERLSAALEALFDVPQSVGRREIYKLHAFMSARESFLAEADAAFEKSVLNLPKSQRTKTKSKRKVADAIAPLVHGNSEESSAELLRAAERQARAYLNQIALFNSHQEEEDMIRDLRTIEAILRKWNIAMHIDAEALGMASLWGTTGPN
jgi:hypothetical protein